MEPGKSHKRTVLYIAAAVIVICAIAYFSTRAHAQEAGAISGSNSTANSGSASQSNAASNQSVGQSATQGNAQSIYFEAAEQRYKTKQEFKTNTSVPLAAAVSFSTDYCGGTASAGASSGGLGISIGGAKPIMDGNCQSLRRAEKFGIMSVTAYNAGNKELAGKLLAMSVWELCTSEANGRTSKEKVIPSTQAGCLYLGLIKPDDMNSVDAMPAAEKAKADAASGAAVEDFNRAVAQQAAPPPPPPAMSWRPR